MYKEIKQLTIMKSLIEHSGISSEYSVGPPLCLITAVFLLDNDSVSFVHVQALFYDLLDFTN